VDIGTSQTRKCLEFTAPNKGIHSTVTGICGLVGDEKNEQNFTNFINEMVLNGDEDVAGLHLHAQCSAIVSSQDACRVLSARRRIAVEIPLGYSVTSGTSSLRVDEISGIAAADAFETIVAVGDAGRLFQMKLQDGFSRVDVLSAVVLQPPESDSFVDAESVAVLCNDPNQPSCSLRDGEATLLVGSEKGTNHRAHISEYFLNGTLKTEDFIPKSVLDLVGLASNNQQNNGGFEAMTATLDHSKIVFSTEEFVEQDVEGFQHIRRVVFFDRFTGEGMVFRYDIQSNDVAAEKVGVTDFTMLNRDGTAFSVIERIYLEEERSFFVKVFYVQKKKDRGIQFSSVASMTPSREEITSFLHSTEPLEVFKEAPLIDFYNDYRDIDDNFEASVLLPGGLLLMASDNNEATNQRTIFATFELKNSSPQGSSSKPGGFVIAAGLLMSLVCFCWCCCRLKSPGRIFLRRLRRAYFPRRRRRRHLEQDESFAGLNEEEVDLSGLELNEHDEDRLATI